MICPRCNMNFGGFLPALNGELESPYLCTRCAQEERDRHDDAETKGKNLALLPNEVILTTTHSLDGSRILEYVGIESVEVLIGAGAFSEMNGDVSDFRGQRTKGNENKFLQAKQTAFQRLKLKANERGANAVVGIHLHYTEFSEKRMGLVLHGTLVVVAPCAEEKNSSRS